MNQIFDQKSKMIYKSQNRRKWIFLIMANNYIFLSYEKRAPLDDEDEFIKDAIQTARNNPHRLVVIGSMYVNGYIHLPNTLITILIIRYETLNFQLESYELFMDDIRFLAELPQYVRPESIDLRYLFRQYLFNQLRNPVCPIKSRMELCDIFITKDRSLKIDMISTVFPVLVEQGHFRNSPEFKQICDINLEDTHLIWYVLSQVLYNLHAIGDEDGFLIEFIDYALRLGANITGDVFHYYCCVLTNPTIVALFLQHNWFSLEPFRCVSHIERSRAHDICHAIVEMKQRRFNRAISRIQAAFIARSFNRKGIAYQNAVKKYESIA